MGAFIFFAYSILDTMKKADFFLILLIILYIDRKTETEISCDLNKKSPHIIESSWKSLYVMFYERILKNLQNSRKRSFVVKNGCVRRKKLNQNQKTAIL